MSNLILNDAIELLIEARQRFKQYELDVDDDAPIHHKRFMTKLDTFLNKIKNTKEIEKCV